MTLIYIGSATCIGLAVWMSLSLTTPADRLARLFPSPGQPAATAAASATVAADPHPPHQETAGDNLPEWLHDAGATHRGLDRRTVISATAAGLVAGVLVGGLAGIVTALLVAPTVGIVLSRHEDPARKETRARIADDLPIAADLMAASLMAGRPVSAATEIVAGAIGGPLGRRLTWVSGQLRLGADPEPTWAHLARDPATGQLARAMSRAAQSGAPVADVLTRVADDARETARTASVAAARSVGVKAVAPLGLCFLPAFVLLGIIPVVAGLATTIVLP
ncbi:type II secretion system F family protein [Nonomuraea sp. NPDC047897]|uniref:type II secretion system F family protein n=1 Tax=Nonomuraea sp. NPDC047897 TaxID=3364346 RepID=UPI0037119758